MHTIFVSPVLDYLRVILVPLFIGASLSFGIILQSFSRSEMASGKNRASAGFRPHNTSRGGTFQERIETMEHSNVFIHCPLLKNPQGVHEESRCGAKSKNEADFNTGFVGRTAEPVAERWTGR
jgi:hypothetical protein